MLVDKAPLERLSFVYGEKILDDRLIDGFILAAKNKEHKDFAFFTYMQLACKTDGKACWFSCIIPPFQGSINSLSPVPGRCPGLSYFGPSGLMLYDFCATPL